VEKGGGKTGTPSEPTRKGWFNFFWDPGTIWPEKTFLFYIWQPGKARGTNPGFQGGILFNLRAGRGFTISRGAGPGIGFSTTTKFWAWRKLFGQPKDFSTK